METKVCSECGKELPIKEFYTWVRKDGTIGVLHQCLHCQRTKANRKHAEKRKIGEVVKYETSILLKELVRRGVVSMETGYINFKQNDYGID